MSVGGVYFVYIVSLMVVAFAEYTRHTFRAMTTLWDIILSFAMGCFNLMYDTEVLPEIPSMGLVRRWLHCMGVVLIAALLIK